MLRQPPLASQVGRMAVRHRLAKEEHEATALEYPQSLYQEYGCRCQDRCSEKNGSVRKPAKDVRQHRDACD